MTTELSVEEKERLIAGTLEWCNERRAEDGRSPLHKLPKGKRNDPTSCPCGKVTGLTVFSDSYSNEGRSNLPSLWLPKPVQEFVEAFDIGLIPELIEEDG